MFKVSYKIYGKFAKEKTFDTAQAAKSFFYGYCVKTPNITSAQLEAISND